MDELRRGLELAGLASAIGPAAADRLSRAASVRRFARGDVLWRAGTPSRGLYIVLEGAIRVLRARHGRQHLVHVATPGATMGEIALFGAGVYPATAIASEDVSCLVLLPDALVEEVRTNAALGHALLRRVARRVEHLVERLETRTLSPVRERVAAALVGLATESGTDLADVHTSQAEWAEDLGTVREVLARELRRLKDEGVVEDAGRRRYRIVDIARLEAIALGLRP